MKYTQLNELGVQNERVEVAMNFLAQEILGVEHLTFPPDKAPIVIEAVENGVLAGAGAIAPSVKLGGYVLAFFAVAPERRGQGFASELLEKIEQRAVQLGSRALLATHPVDERAQKFFTKHGYIPVEFDPLFIFKILY
jgi:GNAT superfamily N-acetyltransferase